MFYSRHKFAAHLAGYFLGAVSFAGNVLAPPYSALAQYVAPVENGEAPKKSSRAGASRRPGLGCSEEDGLTLTLLAPQEHVGQTVSAYPTFVWFVPTAEPLEGGFTIVSLDENGEPEAILEDHRFTTTQGFMTFTLPETSEPLESSESYLLQVYLECDSRRGNDEFVEAFVNVVDAERSPVPLADEPVERAKQFAEAGFWYDALGVLFEVDGSSEVAAYRDQLLLELADLEAAEATDDSDSTDSEDSELNFSESLQQIVE